jgi:hypothetical protein
MMPRDGDLGIAMQNGTSVGFTVDVDDCEEPESMWLNRGYTGQPGA